MEGSAAELDWRAIRLSRTPAARKQHDRINAPEAQTANRVEAREPGPPVAAGVSTAFVERAVLTSAISGVPTG
jgi:hypothetical protein